MNSLPADRYGDFTFARTNNTLTGATNTFTIIAQNPYGLKATNTANYNLPSPVSLSYDSNGNLTNDGLHSLADDAENQLTTNWIAAQWKSEFVCDGFGRRRITRDYGWSGGAWVKTYETRSVYDGLLPNQERDANNATLVIYTRGLDLSGSIHGAGGIGGLLARTDANGSAFYHSNGSGNITALMDTQDDLVARYCYNPFGRLIGKWGTPADDNVMRFSSKEEHHGIVGFGFRWYLPDLQRRSSQDPIGEAGGINLPGFVFNDPINFVDDWGMQAVPVTARPANNQIRGMVANPAINAQIRAELRATGRTQSQLEFDWMRYEAQAARNARDWNRRFIPRMAPLGSGAQTFQRQFRDHNQRLQHPHQGRVQKTNRQIFLRMRCRIAGGMVARGSNLRERAHIRSDI